MSAMQATFAINNPASKDAFNSNTPAVPGLSVGNEPGLKFGKVPGVKVGKVPPDKLGNCPRTRSVATQDQRPSFRKKQCRNSW